jgi:hypothetical protein
VEVAGEVLRLEHQRTPDLGVRPVESAPRRQHANHDAGPAVEYDLPAEDAAVGAELGLPQPVAQHGDIPLAQLIFVRRERPPQNRLDSEDVEVVRRDPRAPQLHGLGYAGERDGTAGLRGHVLEDRVLLLPVQIVQRGNAVPPPSGRLLEHAQDAVRLPVRQRLQQDAIHEAENGGVAPNAQRQRHHRNGGKPRGILQRPETEPEILQKLVCQSTPRAENPSKVRRTNR